ncbi:MAG: hypothetical protein ABEH81_10415 [Halopenitus sp.]
MNPSTDTQTTETPPEESSLIGVDGRAFSLKALLVAVAVLGVGAVAGGFVPIVGSLGRIAGILAAAFALGLLASRRRYVETAIAGAVVGVASAVLGLVTASVLPIGIQFLGEYGLGLSAVGAGLGVVLALVGHYFGRDLRDGLTRDIEG